MSSNLVLECNKKKFTELDSGVMIKIIELILSKNARKELKHGIHM